MDSKTTLSDEAAWFFVHRKAAVPSYWAGAVSFAAGLAVFAAGSPIGILVVSMTAIVADMAFCIGSSVWAVRAWREQQNASD